MDKKKAAFGAGVGAVAGLLVAGPGGAAFGGSLGAAIGAKSGKDKPNSDSSNSQGK